MLIIQEGYELVPLVGKNCIKTGVFGEYAREIVQSFFCHSYFRLKPCFSNATRSSVRIGCETLCADCSDQP